MRLSPAGASARRRWPVWVKEGIKSLAGRLVQAARKLGWRGPEVILILAHPRSGSTLLLHVLASHPAIAAVGERNRRYDSDRDLDALVVDVCSRRRRWPRRNLRVVDQLTHGRVSPRVLAAPSVRVVYLVREPSGCVGSWLRLVLDRSDFGLEEVVDGYRDGLVALARLAGSGQPERAFTLTYEDLVLRTGQSLAALKDFLGLQSPLRPEYRIFEFTGSRGDPGKRIREGRIAVGDGPKAAPVGPDELAELRGVFERTLQTLRARARSA